MNKINAAENKKLLLTNIYELIPAELNEQNKRFKIEFLEKGEIEVGISSNLATMKSAFVVS